MDFQAKLGLEILPGSELDPCRYFTWGGALLPCPWLALKPTTLAETNPPEPKLFLVLQ